MTEFRQTKRPHGLIAAVARRLGLSHEHVRQVASGLRSSRKVAKALVTEERRWDKKKRREQTKVAA